MGHHNHGRGDGFLSDETTARLQEILDRIGGVNEECFHVGTTCKTCGFALYTIHSHSLNEEQAKEAAQLVKAYMKDKEVKCGFCRSMDKLFKSFSDGDIEEIISRRELPDEIVPYLRDAAKLVRSMPVEPAFPKHPIQDRN